MLRGYGQYTVQANTKGKDVFISHPIPQVKRGYAEISSTTRNYVETAKRQFLETADVGMTSNMGGTTQGYGVTGGAFSTPQLYNTLSGILPEESANGRLYRKLFKDIYRYDNVAGSAVDLKSNLPFSSFTLTGVKDKDRLEKYLRSVENLQIVKQLPSITVDYYALGAFLGSLNFDESKGIFTSLMPHDLDDCNFTWVPFAGMDPIIDVNFGDSLKQLLNTKDRRLQEIRQMLPDYILQGMRKGKLELEPLATLYVPRRGLASDYRGNSIYKRLLSIHLVEKALIKGTIDRSMKRQAPILQLICGDENWTPTTDELSNLANLFRDADLDPVNAIVATRTGVQTNSVKQPEDFWRWDGIFDFAQRAKLNALGINDAFLSGDATYSSMDAALTVFVEDLKATRQYMEAEIFYDKMFPAIAVKNDFKKKEDEPIETTGRVEDGSQYCFKNKSGLVRQGDKYVAIASGENQSYNSIDVTQYDIPTIHWHKQLNPIGDDAYFGVLSQLQEAGIPIPLSMWAAAGGVSLDDLINELEEDKAIREKLQKYSGTGMGGMFGDDMAGMSGMGEDDMMSFSSTLTPRIKRKPLLSRKWTNELEPVRFDANGNAHPISNNQKEIVRNKMNKIASQVLAKNAEIENRKMLERDRQLVEEGSVKHYPRFVRNSALESMKSKIEKIKSSIK